MNRGHPMLKQEVHAELASLRLDRPNDARAPLTRWSWQTKPLAEKFEKVKATMPPGKGGSLADQEYLDIVAFILNFNGYPTGDGELIPTRRAWSRSS
jgi:hypothetical protein